MEVYFREMLPNVHIKLNLVGLKEKIVVISLVFENIF